jgi:hypothetical protein
VAMWRPVVLCMVSITSYNDGRMFGSDVAMLFGCEVDRSRCRQLLC